MARFSRGFTGRPHASADPARVPPGQYVTDDFPVLSAGPTPHTPLESWSFTIGGAVDEPASWTWEEFQALPQRDGHGRHPLRHEVVEARHRLDRRLARRAARRRRDERRVRHAPQCDGGYTTNLPLEDVTGGKAWVAYALRRRAARARARRAGAPARSASVLLEEREVGARARAARPRTSRASGRATATTTTETRGRSSATRATDLAARRGRRASSTRRRGARASCSSCPTGRDTAPASTSTCGSPPRTATRRERSYSIASAPEDDAARADGRAARGRRGVARTSPTSCAPATSSSCAARSAATSSGSRRSAARCCSSPAARASCRCGRCCGTTPRPGATVPVRLLYSARHARRRDLPRRAGAARRDDGVDIRFTLTREQPAGWQGYQRPDRPDAARGGRLAGGRAAAGLRLRADARSSRPRRARSSRSATSAAGSRPSGSGRREVQPVSEYDWRPRRQRDRRACCWTSSAPR